MNKGLPIALTGLLGLMFAVSVQAEQTGNLSETVEEAAEAQKETRDDPRNRHIKRGDAYLKQGLLQEAVTSYDAAIALDPKDGTAYVRKGIALYRSGKAEQAIAMMDKAIKVARDDKTWQWLPLYHKGVAQASKGDTQAALKSFTKSIKRNPNHENYQARARTYLQLDELDKALADARTALKHKPDDYPLSEFISRLETYTQTRKDSKAFLKRMAAEDGAHKTKSGLIYFELKKGDGEQPAAEDTVTVHYHGTLMEGKVFESSVNRGEPAKVALNRTIPCWIEALQKMRVGGKAKLICPAELAYGSRGVGSLIKPGAAIVFEVELLGVEQAQN